MLKLVVLACILTTAAAANDSHPPFEVIFQWKSIDYNWPSNYAERQAEMNGAYIPANNLISGIKLWRDKLYLSIPTLRYGIPVTLAVTSATPVNGNISPRLDPYPNWEMQTLGNCSALQHVLSMEIDPLGRMWVIDVGRSAVLESKPNIKCPPRLVIMDLENGGKVLRSYVFPDEVANKNSSFLDDIVLDHENGGWAYITDNGANDPGIIVYSLANNTSWKVRNNASMTAQAETVNVTFGGVTLTPGSAINGIALSPPGPVRLVYYSPLSSFHLYSITTSALQNPTLTDVGPFVTDLGRKEVLKDGMVMTNQNSLYIALGVNDAVGEWNPISQPSFSTGLRTVASDQRHMLWPDSLGIDEYGRVWLTTNNYENYVNNQVNLTQVNYRAWRSDTSARSSQYHKDGSAPELPLIHNASISSAGSRH